MEWLLRAEPLIPAINHSVLKHLSCQNFYEKVVLNWDEVKAIHRTTIGQRNNLKWHEARRGRLTASNFGPVLKSKKLSKTLLSRVLNETSQNLEGVKAVAWGIDHEADAIKEFEKRKGILVNDSGIWISTSGLLGASPDGLVGENSIVEVKCPYSKRNSSLIDAARDPTFYLESVNNTLKLKEGHHYYHQIQGQLYLSRRYFCYFIVWTTCDIAIIIINRNADWRENIDFLESFYKVQMFPKFLEKLQPKTACPPPASSYSTSSASLYSSSLASYSNHTQIVSSDQSSLPLALIPSASSSSVNSPFRKTIPVSAPVLQPNVKKILIKSITVINN